MYKKWDSRRKNGGYVPKARVDFIFMELQRRLGKAEAARRMGVNKSFWTTYDERKYFVKDTVRRAMAVLAEARANNEVRHKDSIHEGAYLRGFTEKVPETRKDYYHPTGDSDLELRKRSRDRAA
jgi:hypothetical protein